MRAFENDTSLRLLKDALARAMDEGSITPRPVEPLANLLFGAMCEVACTGPKLAWRECSAISR